MTTSGGFTVQLGSSPLYNGTYQAVVSSIADPLDLGRVQMFIPQVLGNVNSSWASPATSGMTAPEVGEQVLAVFLGGNINTPMYMTETDLPGNPTYTGLTVTGATSLQSSTISTLTVTGNAKVDGNETITGTLGVTGATTLTGVIANAVTTQVLDIDNETAPSAPTSTATGSVGAKVYANNGILYGVGVTGGDVQLAPAVGGGGAGAGTVLAGGLSSNTAMPGTIGTATVLAKPYTLYGYVLCNLSTTTLFAISFSGPGTTNVAIRIFAYSTTTYTDQDNGILTSLTATGSLGAGGWGNAAAVEMYGIILFSAGGTFTVSGTQPGSAWNAYGGSGFSLVELV